jgi:hypothetical protein
MRPLISILAGSLLATPALAVARTDAAGAPGGGDFEDCLGELEGDGRRIQA